MVALHEVPPPEYSPETLDLIYQAVKDAPLTQLRDVDALDTKVMNSFAAASVVIGLAGLGAANIPRGGLAMLWLLLAIGCYLVVGGLTLTNLRPQWFRGPVNAETLWNTHWDLPPNDVKLAIVEDVRDAYKQNRIGIARKARLLLWTHALIMSEVLCVGFALMSDRLP